jgi:vacuolar protein sorting-associated protein 35
MCSHLFWQKNYRDGKRVLECLQKSLKIASESMETEIHLFVEILNKFLYYYINGNDAV